MRRTSLLALSTPTKISLYPASRSEQLLRGKHERIAAYQPDTRIPGEAPFKRFHLLFHLLFRHRQKRVIP